MGLKKKLHDWNDARHAEKQERHDRKYGRPTTAEANQRLVQALAKGYLQTAMQALKAGASPNALVEYYYISTMDTYPVLSLVVKRGDESGARLLIDAKANLNLGDSFTGHTPLIEAVIRGNTRMVELLLEAGADYTLKTSIHSKYNKAYITPTTALEIAQALAYTDIARLLEEERAKQKALRERQKIFAKDDEKKQLIGRLVMRAPNP